MSHDGYPKVLSPDYTPSPYLHQTHAMTRSTSGEKVKNNNVLSAIWYVRSLFYLCVPVIALIVTVIVLMMIGQFNFPTPEHPNAGPLPGETSQPTDEGMTGLGLALIALLAIVSLCVIIHLVSLVVSLCNGVIGMFTTRDYRFVGIMSTTLSLSGFGIWGLVIWALVALPVGLVGLLSAVPLT